MLSFLWYYLSDGITFLELIPEIKTSFQEYIRMGIDLNSLIVVQKEKVTKDVVYDKDWNIKFKLVFLSKPELQALIGKHTKVDWNKQHQKEETLNAEKLTEEILDTCVKGWSGLTYEWLQQHIPLDMSKIDNPKAEIEFSRENLNTIVKNAFGIDSWILESVKNAANFSEKFQEQVKN